MEDNKVNNQTVTGTDTIVIPPEENVDAGSSTPETKPETKPESKVVQEDTTNKKSDKVEIDKTVLDNILSKLSELEGKTKEFESTASQDQIRKIEALRASGKLVKSVKVRRFNGKLVLAWKMTKDQVWVADGKLHEVQEMDVHYDDGEVESTTLLQFTRGVTYESYEVIEEAKTADGYTKYVVDAGGGKRLEVKSNFIN